MEKLNSSGFGSLTRGYFGFASNMLTGNLPLFLSRNQVSDMSKSLINLQVRAGYKRNCQDAQFENIGCMVVVFLKKLLDTCTNILATQLAC